MPGDVAASVCAGIALALILIVSPILALAMPIFFIGSKGGHASLVHVCVQCEHLVFRNLNALSIIE